MVSPDLSVSSAPSAELNRQKLTLEEVVETAITRNLQLGSYSQSSTSFLGDGNRSDDSVMVSLRSHARSAH
jgi:hypothetical protein